MIKDCLLKIPINCIEIKLFLFFYLSEGHTMASESATDVDLPNEKAAALDVSSEENDGQPPSPDGEQYFMSGPKLGLIIGGLCVALFLLGLDTAIVSTVSNSDNGSYNTRRLTKSFLIGDSKDHCEISLDGRHRLVW